jgi:hypothetical protein
VKTDLISSKSDLEQFSEAHIKEMCGLVDISRELTGEYFRMGMHEALKIPYEFRTLTSLENDEIRKNGDILAAIVRVEYQESRFGRKRDLYQVNIQDHNILRSLEREAGTVLFSPLLLYILTHEIVHIVRFVKFMASFHLEEAKRVNEERTVHTLTHRILSKFPLKGMLEVLEKYRPLTDERLLPLS